MRADCDTRAGVGTCRRAQHQVEGVLRVDGETTYLRRVHGERLGNGACFLAIPVQRQGDQIGGGELEGVPFEDDGGLGCVADAEGGRGRGVGAEGGEDLVLQVAECALRGCFRGFVARDVDVDYGARADVGGKEDRGEFDLFEGKRGGGGKAVSWLG